MNSKISYFFNYSLPFLLGVFIFFNPFPHTTAVKEISFYLALIIALYGIISKKIDFVFDTPFKYPFLFYCLWSIFGLFFAENFNASLHDVLFHLIKYLVFYFLLINAFKTKGQIEALAWISFCSAVVFSIGAIVYFYGIEGNNFQLTIDFVQLPLNVMGHVPIFAIVLGLNFLRPEKKLIYRSAAFLSIIILSILILFTQSRGSILALVFALIVSIKVNKKFVISVFLLFIVISLAFPNRFIQGKFYSSGRVEIWQNYVKAIEKNPFTGVGFDLSFWEDPNVIEKYSLVVDLAGKSMDPHNIFVSNAIRVGLVGLALYIFILFKFIMVTWKLLSNSRDKFIWNWGLALTAAFFAYLIKGLFDESLSHVPAIIFYTILAMQTILWRLNKEAEENAIVSPCSGENISHSDTDSVRDLSK